MEREGEAYKTQTVGGFRCVEVVAGAMSLDGFGSVETPENAMVSDLEEIECCIEERM